ncbi:MAG: bifunctional hydroxymethylpyrimidine kinase/phosphomethylpyrimidine kinase [Thermodesulfovibrionales bacterium]|nr:bifunctional hydroxymethylpyrimidine kinase/phosphomethylpyrimidine kinase [Thermodesulfovibrionales bacterium]
MKIALTIAGSDPTGGAGLQADLRVFALFGVHGISAPTALTSQNTEGIDLILPVEKNFLQRQLDFLLKDIRPDGLKTGMLYTAYAVEIAADIVKEHSLPNLVVDPVTVSSSGRSLVEDGALDLIKQKLFPASRVITPNIYEASLFTGMNIEAESDMKEAARALREMGPEVVIITGGHLDGLAVDLYYDGSDFHRLESEKIRGEYHGTGCAFSAAVAASLALGHSPLEAARRAKEFVQAAIKKAYHPGRGMGLLNIKGAH